MKDRLSENDYDLVYSASGKRAHIRLWTSAFETVCGVDMVAHPLLGTGSQNEYDRAASLQLCARCHDHYFGKDT